MVDVAEVVGVLVIGASLAIAALAFSSAVGEVRTTVAVPLRCTAFLVASAASCGVTPTLVGLEAAGMGAGAWAETDAAPKTSMAARGRNLREDFIADLSKVFKKN